MNRDSEDAMKQAEQHLKLFPWGTSRRYNSYTDYLISRFGERVQKVSVDAGFTCPNRDGTKGFGGCTYCNNTSFVPPYCHPGMSIKEQIEKGVEYLTRRYKSEKFVAYFQAYSNTYAPVGDLKNLYEEALSHPDVIGLSVGTRPDCVDKEKIDYLAELAQNYYITIEYGLESIHNRSLERLNRGHHFEDWAAAIELTANRGINIASHVILGLPDESKSQMFQTADVLAKFPIDYLKIHHLHLVKKTILANQYLKEHFPLLLYRDYLDLVIGFLERLDPFIKIQRLVGETHPRHLLGPKWGLRVPIILKHIEEELEQKNTWQGKKFLNPPKVDKMKPIKTTSSITHL